MKKYSILISVVLVAVALVAILFTVGTKEEEVSTQSQKSIDKVDTMDDNVESAVFLDFEEIYTNYYTNLYESENASFETPTYNTEGETQQVLMSYVGGNDRASSQEAITNISAQISAEMVGLESNEEVVLEFFNATNGQGVALNNPDTTSGQTFWYEVFPNILFLWYYDITGSEALADEAESIYNSFYELVDTLSAGTDSINFDKYTGYNHKTDEGMSNEKWVEPDAAVGIALIMDYAYFDTDDEKYKEAAIKCLNYVNSLDYNPKYEVLSAFGAALAAKYNALYDTNYDVSKFLMWEFDTTSDIRSGWGMMTGYFGDVDIDGIVGSVNDYGGYGFAMNTFVEAVAMAPLAKYDQSYVNAMGKYLYNTYASLTYFYAGSLDSSHYTQPGVYPEEAYVPYEGIKNSFEGEQAYVSGDPTEYGWADSDLCIYAGSYAGIFASIVEPTNVEKVFMFDMNATDFYTNKEAENYLIYNPYAEAVEVTIDTDKDIYNVLDEKVVEGNTVTIPPQTTVQIALVDEASQIKKEGNKIYYDDTLISCKTNVVEIEGIVQNQEVEQTFSIQTTTNVSDVKNMTVYLDDNVIYSGEYAEEIKFENEANYSGQYYLTVELETKDGDIIYDTVSISIGGASNSEVYVSTADSTFTPIDEMAGSNVDGVVSEQNEQNFWGGVATEVIYLDPNKSYTVNMDVSDVNGAWSLQLHVPNDPMNEYGYYIQGDTESEGTFSYSLDALLPQLPTNEDGMVECQLWLIATGEEGANFKVEGLSVEENISQASAYDEEINFDEDDITDMLLNQPMVFYDYSDGIIGLCNKNYTGSYYFKTPTYVANEDSQFTFEYHGDGDVTITLINGTKGEETEIESGKTKLADYNVEAGDVFTIKIEVQSGLNEVLYIDEFQLK